MISLTKKEMRVEVHEMLAEVGGILGCSILKGKSYPKWIERES